MKHKIIEFFNSKHKAKVIEIKDNWTVYNTNYYARRSFKSTAYGFANVKKTNVATSALWLATWKLLPLFALSALN